MYALWILVALRLLVPTYFPVELDLFENIKMPAITTQIAALEQNTHPSFDIIVLPDQSGNNIIEDEVQVPVANDTTIDVVTPTVPSDSITPNETAFSIHPMICIWLIGMIAFGCYFIVSNIRFHRMLLKKRHLLEQYHYKIPVYYVEGLKSPCMTGIINPRIYINERITDRKEDKYVLDHEFTHYKHKDNIWMLIQLICLCIHWYNPLVWIASALFRRDCECACDASLIKSLSDEDRVLYGKTLLQFAEEKWNMNSIISTSTSMSMEGKTMKKRIHIVINHPPKKLISSLVAVILIIVLFAGAFVVNSNSDAGGTNVTDNSVVLSYNEAQPYVEVSDTTTSRVDANGHTTYWHGVLYETQTGMLRISNQVHTMNTLNQNGDVFNVLLFTVTTSPFDYMKHKNELGNPNLDAINIVGGTTNCGDVLVDRVYYVDEHPMKTTDFSEEELEQWLAEYGHLMWERNHIETDSTKEDVLYELSLRTMGRNDEKITSNQITVPPGDLVLSLSEEISDDVVNGRVEGNYIDGGIHNAILNIDYPFEQTGRDGTVITASEYIMNDVKSGQEITVTITEELQERLGLPDNEIVITCMGYGSKLIGTWERSSETVAIGDVPEGQDASEGETVTFETTDTFEFREDKTGTWITTFGEQHSNQNYFIDFTYVLEGDQLTMKRLDQNTIGVFTVSFADAHLLLDGRNTIIDLTRVE